jgi:hypothetical protein
MASSSGPRSLAPRCAPPERHRHLAVFLVRTIQAAPGALSHAVWGWMRWHHYAGLVFGFFAGTSALSGALSLTPGSENGPDADSGGR